MVAEAARAKLETLYALGFGDVTVRTDIFDAFRDETLCNVRFSPELPKIHCMFYKSMKVRRAE